MKRFAVLVDGLESGIAITAVTPEQAAFKLNQVYSLRATMMGHEVTIAEERPRCVQYRCPLPMVTDFMCRAHRHQVGTKGKKCKLKGCTRGHYAKGWCRPHYIQAYEGRKPGPIRKYARG